MEEINNFIPGIPEINDILFFIAICTFTLIGIVWYMYLMDYKKHGKHNKDGEENGN